MTTLNSIRKETTHTYLSSRKVGILIYYSIAEIFLIILSMDILNSDKILPGLVVLLVSLAGLCWIAISIRTALNTWVKITESGISIKNPPANEVVIPMDSILKLAYDPPQSLSESIKNPSFRVRTIGPSNLDWAWIKLKDGQVITFNSNISNYKGLIDELIQIKSQDGFSMEIDRGDKPSF